MEMEIDPNPNPISYLEPNEKQMENQNQKENPRVFFDITIDGTAVGRLVMELFADKTPITAENFRALCTGENGIGQSGKAIHYRGSKFHRVIPNFICQGGDITEGDGTGGESIYGGKFADENFVEKHSTGTLSMVNSGKGTNTNGSQFFICLGDAAWLNNEFVVFGHVVEGTKVLAEIESVGSKCGRTSKSVVIADCGQL